MHKRSTGIYSAPTMKQGESEEWTQVTRRTGKPDARTEQRRRKAKELSLALKADDDDDSGSGKYNSSVLVESVRLRAAALRHSAFYAEVQEACRNCKFRNLVSLGIGNFATSKPALLQLALALCLQEDYLDRDDEAHVSAAYDPHFTDCEAQVCRALGMSVPLTDAGLLTAPTAHTLFLMPHCPYRLYAEVLWRSWHALPLVTILGNSFTAYALRSLPSSLPPACDSVHLLQEVTSERGLWRTEHACPPPGSARQAAKESIYPHIEGAFGDMSAHTFCNLPSEGGPVRPTRQALDALPPSDNDT